MRDTNIYPYVESSYSFKTPAWEFWEGFAQGLIQRGLSDEAINEVISSKLTRWMFDSKAEKVRALGKRMAKEMKQEAIDSLLKEVAS